jgi:hypothetical protein
MPTATGLSTITRRAILRTILDLREAIEEDYRRQLRAMEVGASGVGPFPSDRKPNDEDVRIREVASAVIGQAMAAGATAGEAVERFVRESAFTFLNRAVGFRCLEERGMLLVNGQAETLWTVDPARNTSSLYWRARADSDPTTPPREIWRKAILQASAGVSQQVGLLFDPRNEHAALLPLLPTIQKVAAALTAPDIPPDTYRQDELLGWVYQYYNNREKDAVYERLGKGQKLTKPEDVAAATCLYTERYMVDYLLQNTLGALWVERHPESRLPEGWAYFVRAGAGGTPPGRPTTRLRDVTILDPACGSGHFLVRAFDLLVEMYREEGIEPAEEIPHLILENNLHGIDVDGRSIQIAALALYLKACALAGPGFRPRRLNLVAADAVLPGDAPPPKYLARFQGRKEDEDLVTGIWRGLKNVRTFGSLLHPERAVDEVVRRRRERERGTFWAADAAQWEQWKRDLLNGLHEEFERQAQLSDLGQRLFGEHAAKGVSLVEALSKHYDVVIANPPYQGSGSLDADYKKFLEKEYKVGKSDLYAAFILRCRDFARPGGHVGMVTQQSWMFLRSFADLRKLILEQTSLTTIAHLGPRAFEEISGEVVNIALFTLRAAPPAAEHRLTAFRLIGPKSAAEKDALLRRAIYEGGEVIVFRPSQLDILAVPFSPLTVYNLPPKFFQILRLPQFGRYGDVSQGSSPNVPKHVRQFWEVEARRPGWVAYAKGGGYRKWYGCESWIARWPTFAHDPDSTVRGEKYFFRGGLCATTVARGKLGVRQLPANVLFSDASCGIFSDTVHLSDLAGEWNTHLFTLLARSICGKLDFSEDYLRRLPSPVAKSSRHLADAAMSLKYILTSYDLTERVLLGPPLARSISGDLALLLISAISASLHVCALLHTLEGINEERVCKAYDLGPGGTQLVVGETGTPAGWYPLIEGLDQLTDVGDLPEVAQDAYQQFVAEIQALPRKQLETAELAELRQRLRAHYLAGPGASVEEDDASEPNDEEAVAVGGFIPIPAETFLEELSQKLKVHPITVANLIDELYAETRLPTDPFARRQVEDYFSFVVLRLLGYTWPTPLEGELTGGRWIPTSAIAEDGIIPLVPCGDVSPLERRIAEVMGEDDAAVFGQVMGRDLGEWLRKDFFKRHVQQFKQRPIAWHLASPERTFEVFVLYHQLSLATLQTLRTRYAGGLIEKLRVDLARAKERKDEAALRRIQAQIEDIEDFRERLAKIERGSELKARIRCRWKGEEAQGRPGPYAPDIDDGVKVNLRPFQEMGVLAIKEVIKKW